MLHGTKVNTKTKLYWCILIMRYYSWKMNKNYNLIYNSNAITTKQLGGKFNQGVKYPHSEKQKVLK